MFRAEMVLIVLFMRLLIANVWYFLAREWELSYSTTYATRYYLKDDFRWMNPFLIYQEMAAGTGKGWCTQHAQILFFYANRTGIPTRLLLGSQA